MEIKVIIGKTAVSRDHVLLGKITRIDYLIGKTIKKRKPHAMIRVKEGLFQKALSVPIDMEKFVEVKDKDALFDIFYKEFKEEKNRVKNIKYVREHSGEYPGASSRTNVNVRIPRKRGD